MVKKNTDHYNANDIVELSYPLNVIRNPAMYLGERGHQQTVGVREIIDNASGENVKGYATKMRLIFHKDKSVSIQDDGRGLPVDTNDKSGKNGIILTMATLHSGSSFNTHVGVGKSGAGVHGVGASVTNALCKRFDVTVYRDDKIYQLSFHNGVAGFFAKDNDPDSAFTESTTIKVSDDKRKVKDKKEYPHGTLIRLWYNDDYFDTDDNGKPEEVDTQDLINRLDYLVYDLPHFDITVTDELHANEDGTPQQWHFYSDDGLVALVEKISPLEQLQGTGLTIKGDSYAKKGIYSFVTQTAPYKEKVTTNDGKHETVERIATIRCALRYSPDYEPRVLGFVNTIHVANGGVHEDALKESLTSVLVSRMRSMRSMLNAKDNDPTVDDILEGLTAVISVNVPEPQFVGQQKDKLSGPEVKRALKKTLTDTFTNFFADSKNQKAVKPIFDKIKSAMKTRESALLAKEVKRKNSKLGNALNLPSKLHDCELIGDENSELLICEGDSALGTVSKARQAVLQGCIPVRGKILNCYNASMKRILANQEIMDIAKALGAGFGKEFDTSQLRYSRVLFTADADTDGLQINNLLYTVFYQCFRPMIEEGRVYQTVPPLFEVTLKNNDVVYCANDLQLQKTKDDLAQKNIPIVKIERLKGLGEMEAGTFAKTVLDPRYRTLRRVMLKDVDKARQALELTMGTGNTEERKKFMTDNYHVALESGFVEI